MAFIAKNRKNLETLFKSKGELVCYEEGKQLFMEFVKERYIKDDKHLQK